MDAFSGEDEYPEWKYDSFISILKQMRFSHVSIVFKPSNNKNKKFSRTSPNYKAKYNILNEKEKGNTNNKFSEAISFLKSILTLKFKIDNKFYFTKKNYLDLNIDQNY